MAQLLFLLLFENAVYNMRCNVNILNMSLVFIFVCVLVLLLPEVFQVEPITFSE